MIRSFDVFDTCLSRKLAVPTDLFRVMAPSVAEARRVPLTPRFTDELSWARAEGEARARKASSHDEITLDEIWDWTCRLLGWEPDERFLRLEMETEESLLYPVPSTLERVLRARDRGERVIFISDSPLPEDFIRRMLRTHDFLAPEDGLYVSSAIRKRKASGALFRHVIEAEEISPSQLLHTGDNPRSDHARASELGIESRLVSPVELSRTERAVATDPALDPDVSSLWAGAMREARLHTRGNADGVQAAHLISQLAAPVLFSFVTWVLRQAASDGVERLYFASRDGRIACRMASELSDRFGGIECRYLYISRQALCLPASTEISPKGMPWMRRSWETPELRRLLSKVELAYSDAEETWRPLTGGMGERFVLRTEDEWNKFWNILSGSELGPCVRRRIEERRETALDYLEVEGLFDPVESALVDFGWGLTCQRALHKLRSARACSHHLSGYYLQCSNRRPATSATGPATALFSPVPGDRRRLTGPATPLSFAPVIEHCLGLADHDAVHHYERRNGCPRPCSTEGPIRHEADPLFDEVKRTLSAFARINAGWTSRLVPDRVAARGVIAAIVDQVLVRAPREVVKEVADISGSEDQAHRWARPVVRRLTVSEAVAEMIPWSLRDALGHPPPRPWWLQGSLRLTGIPTRLARKTVLGIVEVMRGLRRWVGNVLPPEVKDRLRTAARRE